MLNALSYSLNSSILHSVSSDRESLKVWSTLESLSDFSGSKCSKTTIINQKNFKTFSLFQIVKESFSTERIDCVVAYIKFDEIFSDQTFWDVLDWLRDFLFKSWNKDIVNIEIFDLFHLFKLFS